MFVVTIRPESVTILQVPRAIRNERRIGSGWKVHTRTGNMGSGTLSVRYVHFQRYCLRHISYWIPQVALMAPPKKILKYLLIYYTKFSKSLIFSNSLN